VQSSVISRGSSRAIATLVDGVTRKKKPAFCAVFRGFSHWSLQPPRASFFRKHHPGHFKHFYGEYTDWKHAGNTPWR